MIARPSLATNMMIIVVASFQPAPLCCCAMSIGALWLLAGWQAGLLVQY